MIARCDSSDEHGNDTSGPCSSDGGSEDGSGNTNGVSAWTERQVYEELKKMDWSIEDNKFLKAHPEAKQEIETVKNEFFKYHAINIVERYTGAPAYLIDEYWHMYILNTKRYERDAKLFGKFIHHTPTDGSNESEKENIKHFNETIRAYVRVFGVPPESIWGNNKKLIAECRGGIDETNEGRCKSDSETDSRMKLTACESGSGPGGSGSDSDSDSGGGSSGNDPYNNAQLKIKLTACESPGGGGDSGSGGDSDNGSGDDYFSNGKTKMACCRGDTSSSK